MSYNSALIVVSHSLNHFRWHEAMKAEEGVSGLTADERDGLIERIVRSALRCPNSPPLNIDFYQYLQKIENEETKRELTECMMERWPAVSWKIKGEKATRNQIDQLPESTRVTKYNALVKAEIVDKEGNTLPSKQNHGQVEKKRYKRLPPHLRGL